MRIKFLALVVILLTIIYNSIAQVPAGFNYQGVLRNSSGEVLENSEINLRISIIQSSITNNPVYIEIHVVTTNNFGVFNLQVGTGEVITGNFNTINWSNGPYFVKTELDEYGGSSYTELGTVPLLSVPYAMFANDVANKDDADADPENEIQNLNFDNNILTISKNSSSTQINLAPFQGNNTDEQILTLSGTDLSISGGNTIDVSSLQDGVDDADNDSGNELQNLNLKGDTLSISNGNQVILPDSSRWEMSGNKLYYNSGNVGVGTNNPVSKLEVKSTATSGALFQVINANNDTVFAVYPDGVKVFVNPDAKGKVGGFAVSGRSPSKSGSVDFMRVTGDSTRIYVNSNSGKAKVGGFAVSGRSPSKGIVQDYLLINEDSTRIYVKDTTMTKAKVGGFAVSGRSPSKGSAKPFLNMNRYNYFIGHESGKSNTTGLINSFFGYQSGYNNTSGDYNLFQGYQTGFNNKTGRINNYIGYQTAYSSTKGSYNNMMGFMVAPNDTNPSHNVMMGYEVARYANHNYMNIMIGTMAARNTKLNSECIMIGANVAQTVNQSLHSMMIGNYAGAMCDTSENDLFIGEKAGLNIKNSYMNTIIGTSAARELTSGKFNVMVGGHIANHYSGTHGNYNTILGYQAGYNCKGDNNIFIGYAAGSSETGSNKLYIANSGTSDPLIKGDFSTGKTTLNNILNINDRNDYPNNPSEGDVIRLKNHSSDHDGLYIYTGSVWKSVITW